MHVLVRCDDVELLQSPPERRDDQGRCYPERDGRDGEDGGGRGEEGREREEGLIGNHLVLYGRRWALKVKRRKKGERRERASEGKGGRGR